MSDQVEQRPLDRQVMCQAEFNQLYSCEFKPTQREVDLDARLEKYYRDTQGLDNKSALPHYIAFSDWCRACGYDTAERNLAKRRVTIRLGI